MKTILKHMCGFRMFCSLAKACHKIKVFSVLCVLLALDKTFEVFKKSNVLLVL